MLYRRLEQVQTLITATRQLDRAKPEKKEAVSVHGVMACLLLLVSSSSLLLSLHPPFLPPSLPPQAEVARSNAMTAYEKMNKTAKTEVRVQSVPVTPPPNALIP